MGQVRVCFCAQLATTHPCVLQAGLQAKPKLGTRDSMELGIAGAGTRGRVPRTAAEVADPRWVIDKVAALYIF